MENSLSSPRSSVTLATIATRIAGTAAMMVNRPTVRTCSLAPARPLRRACTTCQTSRTMTASSSTTVAAFTNSRLTTTLCVGKSGVRSASTTKVAKADNKASPTAIGPRMRVSPRAAGALASDGFGGSGLFRS